MENERDCLLLELKTNMQNGLTDEVACDRLEVEGKNLFAAEQPVSILSLIWGQLNHALIYILIVAVAISFIVQEYADAFIILIVIILNTVVGVIQESKAEKALQALKDLSTPHAIVKRDGVIREINAEDLVRGDIVLLEAGAMVPADIRLLETANLQIEESALTGESVPVTKNANWGSMEGESLGDKKHMAFKSTLVTYGRGVGVVVATGMQTEVGKIASLLHAQQKVITPLQKKLNELGKFLAIGAFVISVIIFFIGFMQGRETIDMFLIAVSLAVAVIPEGLPAIVTIVLALGVQRMIKRNAVIRHLPAVETLGGVNVICSDKTGTLTENKMTVTHAFINKKLQPFGDLTKDNLAVTTFLRAIILCNDATNEAHNETGDPTEIALLNGSDLFGLFKNELEMTFPRIDEIPFDSDRKMMTTVHEDEAYYYVFTKGAVESVLPLCTNMLIQNEEHVVDGRIRTEILEATEAMANLALRVLAVGYRKLEKTNNLATETLESDFVFLGLTGMIDPPRKEVKNSVLTCHEAGINVVMITGDHQKTALAIAQQLSIASAESETMTGVEIELLTDEQLQERAEKIHVFARVSPEHKLRIVRALQAEGNVVSMTGDGVNDAPSLKQADVGVAMGITGTDVAKGAADVVLTDDNFATITAAVEEGRNIYQNIKKSILFLLSCNVGEIITLFIAIMLGWPAPLTAIHILWVNLITDTLPAIALGVDAKDPHVMKEQPRLASEGIFTKKDISFIMWNGLLIGLLALIAFIVGLEKNVNIDSIFSLNLHTIKGEALIHAQALAFLTLSISQLFHAFNLRSRNQSIFQIGFLGNRYLVGAVMMGILLQAMLVHIPVLSKWFHLGAISLNEWIFVFFLALIPILINELAKMFRRK